MKLHNVDSLPLADIRRLLDRLSAAQTAGELADLALPAVAALTEASAAAMWIIDDRDGLELVGSWGASNDVEPYISWCRTAILTRATNPVDALTDDSEPRWVSAASLASAERADAFEASRLVGSLVVPLRTDGACIGALELAATADASTKDAGDLAGIFAAMVAQRTSAIAARADLTKVDRVRRNMFENLADAFVAIDRHGVITIFNPAAERMFGFRREDVLGKPVDEVIVPPSFRPFHRAGLVRFHETGSGTMVGERRRLAAMRRDGSQFPVDIAVVELGLDETAFGAFLRDATAEAEVETALVESGQRFAEQARELQRSFLPSGIPGIDGLDLAVRYVSAGADAEVGGDFYDVFPVAGEGWAVALGDVQGKGLEAAAVMALARFAMRGLATGRSEPSNMLASLNDVLLADQTNRSCTLVYGRLTRRGDGFDLVIGLAGHPRPLLVRDGQVTAVGHSGLLLGLRPATHHVEERVHLVPGDVLLLYTDGLTEARSVRGDFFGEQRVRDALGRWAHLDAATIGDRLERTVLEFQDYDASDDIALIVMKVPSGGGR